MCKEPPIIVGQPSTPERNAFSCELIRPLPIFLFISTHRALISARLHNTAILTPQAHPWSPILFESMEKSAFPALSSHAEVSSELLAQRTIFNQQLPSGHRDVQCDVTHPRDNISRNPLIKRTIFAPSKAPPLGVPLRSRRAANASASSNRAAYRFCFTVDEQARRAANFYSREQ